MTQKPGAEPRATLPREYCFIDLAGWDHISEISSMENLPPVFWELYGDLPQQGPGSDASTEQAIGLIPDLPPNPHILDVGCGSGRQSLCLARCTGGELVAVDNHQPFLDRLNQSAAEQGLGERIITQCASMDALTFQASSFDLIWSEGAIYIIGFERGLREFRKFLKPGGVIAVTEITWLRDDPAAELKEFWEAEYPAMSTRSVNESAIAASGYQLLETFALPDSDWWDNYYKPLEARAREMRQKYAGDQEALEVISVTEKEIELFQKFSDFYGYVFYLMRK